MNKCKIEKLYQDDDNQSKINGKKEFINCLCIHDSIASDQLQLIASEHNKNGYGVVTSAILITYITGAF